MSARRTDPSRSAVDQSAGFKYSDSHHTDIGKRFAAIKREQAKAQRVAAAAEFQQAQQALELEPGAQVLPLFKQAI